MVYADDVLISVRQKHSRNMLRGRKTAEVRRRAARIRPGTRVWVYSKMPRGRVELVATVEGVIVAHPQDLWDLYQDRLSVTFTEFQSYLNGVKRGCVILLQNIEPLQPTLDLESIRRISKKFQPPQFFKRLVPNGPELQNLIFNVPSLVRERSTP
ncbi:MAG TPA: transcriptional regulator [Candidatus Dormibacteraeota bacterium]|nr:transcriptional regulator [Candidatus Dormibacteraeota bacterium]